MIEKSFERQHNLAVAARVKMVLRLFNELKLYCPEGWCHQHETIIMNSHYISGLFFHSLNKERLLCTVFLFVTRNCGRCFYRHCHHNHSSVFGLNDYICWPKHLTFTIVFLWNTQHCFNHLKFALQLVFSVDCCHELFKFMKKKCFTSSPVHSVLPDYGKRTWLAVHEGGSNPRLDSCSE